MWTLGQFCRHARGLRGNRTYAIRIIADDISQIFTAQIVRGVCDQLRDNGYSSVIVHTDSNSDHEKNAVAELDRRSVDGFIFVDTSFKVSSNKALDITKRAHVFVNRGHVPGNNTIGPDDYYGSQLAVTHLIQLGYQRIAYIGGPDGWRASRERLAGYRDALVTQGGSNDELVRQGRGLTIWVVE